MQSLQPNHRRIDTLGAIKYHNILLRHCKDFFDPSSMITHTNTTLFQTLSRRMASKAAGNVRTMASLEPYADYGKHVFSGAVADEYLKNHGASAELLKDPSWVKHSADTVAAAVLDW